MYFLMDAKLDPVRYSFKLLIASSTSCMYVLSGFARPLLLDDDGVEEAGCDGVFLLPTWLVAAVAAAFVAVFGDSTTEVPSFSGVASVLGCDGRFFLFLFLLVTVVAVLVAVVVSHSSVVTVRF